MPRASQRQPACPIVLPPAAPPAARHAVGRVREWLTASPEANIVSISQDDTWGEGTGACRGPDGAAIDDREGSHAGSRIALLNYRAGRLGPACPH
ncbi:MAG TPA: hypothetical protein PK794_10745, partial [Armatimonadota bacterium]|nr:hypothetical protein [Armatimonadota bacterium]